MNCISRVKGRVRAGRASLACGSTSHVKMCPSKSQDDDIMNMLQRKIWERRNKTWHPDVPSTLQWLVETSSTHALAKYFKIRASCWHC